MCYHLEMVYECGHVESDRRIRCDCPETCIMQRRPNLLQLVVDSPCGQPGCPIDIPEPKRAENQQDIQPIPPAVQISMCIDTQERLLDQREVRELQRQLKAQEKELDKKRDEIERTCHFELTFKLRATKCDIEPTALNQENSPKNISSKQFPQQKITDMVSTRQQVSRDNKEPVPVNSFPTANISEGLNGSLAIRRNIVDGLTCKTWAPRISRADPGTVRCLRKIRGAEKNLQKGFITQRSSPEKHEVSDPEKGVFMQTAQSSPKIRISETPSDARVQQYFHTSESNLKDIHSLIKAFEHHLENKNLEELDRLVGILRSSLDSANYSKQTDSSDMDIKRRTGSLGMQLLPKDALSGFEHGIFQQPEYVEGNSAGLGHLNRSNKRYMDSNVGSEPQSPMSRSKKHKFEEDNDETFRNPKFGLLSSSVYAHSI